jgi:hypothetical protein
MSYSEINSVFSYQQPRESPDQYRPPSSSDYREEMRETFSDPVMEQGGGGGGGGAERFTSPNYYEPDENVRKESVKNIQSLNEIIRVTTDKSNSVNQSSTGGDKRVDDKVEQNVGWAWDVFLTFVKEPIIMILLYIAIHNDLVSDFISSRLPPSYNNPMNMFKFYGVRGFVYTVSYYVFRNYRI